MAERIAGVRSVKHKEAAAAIVRELGFAFTVNVVLHRANLDRIGSIIDLAADLGADRVELANTQYYGWGLQNRAALMPTREQVERSREIAERAVQQYRGTDADHVCAAGLLRGVSEGVLRRLGEALPRGHSERECPAVPRRHRNHHAPV